MPKRFYKTVSLVPEKGGFAVQLDGRVIKTPKRKALVLPTKALAEEVAREWDRVGDDILMDQLPVTRLAFGALDKSAEDHAKACAEIVNYARSDLVCYRADDPESLVVRQHDVWQPLLDWAEAELGVGLKATIGIMSVTQPEPSLEALKSHLSELDTFESAGLHPAVVLLGSAVIALALYHGKVSAKEAAEAALLDELWQEERWGQDDEASARRARIFAEVGAIERYFAALRR